MLAYLASKPQKVPITRICKPKKMYKFTTVLSQIYERTVAQSQIPNIIFYSKSLLFPSLRCLFSIFYSPLLHNNPIQTPLSHHISLQLTVVGIFWRGSQVWRLELGRGFSGMEVGHGKMGCGEQGRGLTVWISTRWVTDSRQR